ncbi:MAG: F0F1 ATP synthase subunit B [Planctomycetaceae bacterium]|nr:F0F1 ATP synthase subunit B [Planctomycetaceae bacterium]
MNKRIITAISIALLFGGTVVASEEAAPAQEGIFSGSYADALWTVIAFGTLVIVLGIFAWKPLLRSLKTREDTIQQQLSDAENAKSKAEHLLDEHKHKSLDIIERANKYANQTSKEIVEQARKEALAITDRANAEIAGAQGIASQQLWHMAGNMLINISQEVLGRSITPEDNKRLIHEAIGKLQEESLNK